MAAFAILLVTSTTFAQPDAKPIEFTGRLHARDTVEFRARVTSVLTKIHFKAGDAIKKGDVLFELDSRQQQLAVARAEAELRGAEARRSRLQADHERIKKLWDVKAVSQEEVARIAAQVIEADAALTLVKFNLEAAKLELDFTRIVAPMDGVIGAPRVSPGNLVRAADMVLAEAVAMDVLDVYFDMDERTLLRLLRAKSGQLLKSQVVIGLADGQEYKQKGAVSFLDNRLNPETGTIRIRASVPNPDRLLLPGMFVRVSMVVGDKK